MVTEIWKVHPIFGGKYEVSSKGNIRHIRNKKNLTMHLTYGYCYPTLSNENGVPRCRRLHRLIAEMFIPNPDNKPYVNHKNGIKNDNRIENLEWVTGTENNKHSIYQLGNKINNGQKKPISQFDADGNYIKDFPSVSSAGKELGIGHQQISNNLVGKQKYCHGFIFRYKE